jgi:hypothetical protein
MPKKKITNIILIIAAIILICVITINFVFFFNPFTFRKDHVTNLPWSLYRGELVLEFYDQGGEEIKMKTTNNREEIKRFIDNLKRGTRVPKTVALSTLGKDQIGSYSIMLRRKSDNVNLLVVNPFPEQGIARIGNNYGDVYVEIIPALEMTLKAYGFSENTLDE